MFQFYTKISKSGPDSIEVKNNEYNMVGVWGYYRTEGVMIYPNASSFRKTEHTYVNKPKFIDFVFNYI